MRVLLAGATGVIGRRLLPALLARGHTVVATTRRADGADALRAAGAEPVVADALDAASIAKAAAAAQPEVVVHQLTAIPPRIDPRRAERDLAATNRLRTEGTRNLLAAARAAGARRFVAQSISFVCRPAGAGLPALSTEDEPLHPGPGFASIVHAVGELERLVVDEGKDVQGVALRYGLFWGPGTVYDRGGSFHEDVLARKVPLVAGGPGVFSFIHLDDAAEATVLAVEGTAAGRFNIVDDRPRTVGEFLPEYARRLGARPPWRVPRWLARLGAGPYAIYLMCEQRGASNARAKAALGWQPRRTDGAPGP